MTLETTGGGSGAWALLQRLIARALPATPQERAAALWSFAYFFTLLAGYYVLRPLRDQMAITGGIRNLPWLFTATFVTLLVAQPLYGLLVAKLPRARFIPIVNHFFVFNLVLFWLFLTLGIETALVARRQAAVRFHRRRRHSGCPARTGPDHLAFDAAWTD
jgi:ATP:ADP antiporter, AAA family